MLYLEFYIRDLETKKIEEKYSENLKMCYWRRMEIKWPEKVTNEEVLERIGEKRTLQNTILIRKANWIGHIQRRLPPS